MPCPKCYHFYRSEVTNYNLILRNAHIFCCKCDKPISASNAGKNSPFGAAAAACAGRNSPPTIIPQIKPHLGGSPFAIKQNIIKIPENFFEVVPSSANPEYAVIKLHPDFASVLNDKQIVMQGCDCDEFSFNSMVEIMLALQNLAKKLECKPKVISFGAGLCTHEAIIAANYYEVIAVDNFPGGYAPNKPKLKKRLAQFTKKGINIEYIDKSIEKFLCDKQNIDLTATVILLCYPPREMAETLETDIDHISTFYPNSNIFVVGDDPEEDGATAVVISEQAKVSYHRFTLIGYPAYKIQPGQSHQLIADQELSNNRRIWTGTNRKVYSGGESNINYLPLWVYRNRKASDREIYCIDRSLNQ